MSKFRITSMPILIWDRELSPKCSPYDIHTNQQSLTQEKGRRDLGIRMGQSIWEDFVDQVPWAEHYKCATEWLDLIW